MNFNLRKPCKGCPFRTDCLKGWLGAKRAAGIAASILEEDKTFPCHKTTSANGFSGQQSHCSGALILLEKAEETNGNFLLRLAQMAGLYDPAKLDLTAPVFDSPEAFIRHHAG